MRIGYHASHEQHPPSALLEYAQQAEAAGFDAEMCSDHFMPWSTRQASSGLSWSWLASALQATIPSYGTVAAPGDRYHPAIVAQAIATLGQMYPGRLWVALASGERLNEHITGAPWPDKATRNARLRECVDVIRRLLRGEAVTHSGLVDVQQARLHVLPEQPVALFGAALTTETAEWAGEWADGLITAAANPEDVAPIIEHFRRGGGAGKPVAVQAVVSWAESDEAALDAAYEQWRQAALPPEDLANLATPEAFDAAVADIPRERIAELIPSFSDPAQHVRLLRRYAELDADSVYVHNVALNQPAFIEMYGRDVLPSLRRVAQ